VPTTGNYFHLHLVSDSTGETLITVARAVAAQYANVTPVEHVYPLVRSQKQLDRVLDEIEEAPGIVLFTLLEKDLVGRLEGKCREINVPSLSIIGPVMQLFEAYLGAATTGRVGAQHVLNAEYFKRIDALNFTMMTASTSKAWRRPTSSWSACRAPRKRRPRFIWPTAASAPPMFRWCRAFRYRTNWRP
jgi:[pyruvate, water dikinase]-phosphate phosphotransferase / [pyruvate, water dikinase] kinase